MSDVDTDLRTTGGRAGGRVYALPAGVASDEIVSGLTRAGFLQMLEKCIATNSTVAEAADMVRRASQAQQVLAAAASRSSAAVPVIAAEPEESSQPQANDDDQESSLA